MATKIVTAADLKTLREHLVKSKDPNRKVVSICAGTGCCAYGSMKLAGAFEQALGERGLKDQVELRLTGCHGFCERGPLVVIHPQEILYQRVKPDDVPEILDSSVAEGQVIENDTAETVNALVTGVSYDLVNSTQSIQTSYPDLAFADR